MSLLDDLREVVGSPNLLDELGDVLRFEHDGRSASGKALAVARPATVAEVSSVVRLAARAGVGIVPQGARTGLAGAGLADATGKTLILSLERLARPPLIDAVNRTAEVDAGVLLSTLNLAASEWDLMFPIDLGADPSIGGMIAANTGGARFIRYGDVRRNLLKLEVVRADGSAEVVTLGRDVWKDNSGLDLKQMFVGSSGSLGIITRATLALCPKPAVSISAMIALNDPDLAPDLLVAMEAAFGTLLSAFEGISGNALRAALDHVPRLRDPFPGTRPRYVLLIELSGGAAFDESLLEERLAAMIGPWFEDGRISDASIDHRDGLWAVRHAVPEALRAAGRVVACDIALRRGDVMRFRSDVGARLAQSAPQLVLHDFGHIGDGGLHFNMVWADSAGAFDPAVAEQARNIVFSAAVEEYGGSFSAEHGIGPANAAYYARFVPEPTRRLAGAIQDLMAPVPIGRVAFGMTDVAGGATIACPCCRP